MKNLFSAAFIAAAAVLLSGCTSGGKYVIEGSGDQLVDGHWMYVSDGVDWSMLDSALIENGTFRIEGTDMGSGVAMLYMGASSAPSGLYQMSEMIFLEPGTVSLEYIPDYEMYFAHGTPMNDLYYELSFGDAGDYEDPLDIIRDNHNVLGLTLLQGMLAMSSKPEIEAVLAEFPENMRVHPLYIQLEEMLEPIKADLGMPYWDIEGKDVNGNAVQLRDVVNALYDRYHGSGFEIYGMSFDSSPENWRSALKEFGMNWTNVITEVTGSPSTSPIWAGYGMDGIPWNYLIDASTGEIIAKNLRGETLAAELEALFAEQK